ncbi:MAG: cytochrome-c oxidase, cbb3-type subunit III, partial [Alphaproteobacteria bacterium CG_4_10_14_0_8_um_filter_53_9]
VWMFLICVLYAIGYVAYYPAFPTIHKTVSGWTSLGQLKERTTKAKEGQQQFETQIQAQDIGSIEQNPQLRTYAVAAGKMLFAINCSQCHGAGAGGTKGYPNLLDDEWIHGGSLSDIAYTITHGIRHMADENTRDPGPMLAFGKDELLSEEEINDVVNYLSVLAYGYKASESATRGRDVFLANCTLCHGENGEGNRELGAPPLNNPIWQFGGTTKDLKETLHNGRAAVMPAWQGKLSESDIKKLAVYVHTLGGGEAEKQPEPQTTPEAAPLPAPVEAPMPEA